MGVRNIDTWGYIVGKNDKRGKNAKIAKKYFNFWIFGDSWRMRRESHATGRPCGGKLICRL
jgi:hypothetical protein